MICLIQRVTQASVEVDQQTIGKIDQGILVLAGFKPDDDSAKIDKMIHKLLHYRMFSDENDKMNLNVQQIDGGLLLIPQFTLAADTNSGLRPSFSSSAPPAQASLWFDEFVDKTRQKFPKIACGQFGTDMQVSLINDGPVTFRLEN